MKRLTDMEKRDIELKVNNLLETHKNIPLYDGWEVNVVTLANDVGFVVGHAMLPEGTEGIIAVDKDQESLLGTGSNMVIAVSPKMDRSEQRFIIAHEMGHYFLRKKVESPIYAHRETAHGRDEQENDADYFAACLLMPKERFVSAMNGLKAMDESMSKEGIATRLSKQFGVSELAAYRRIGEVSGSAEGDVGE